MYVFCSFDLNLIIFLAGLHTLDKDILGFDEKWRPLYTQPPNPKSRYDTISTFYTRASRRQSIATVAMNRVSRTSSKSKSSPVVVSKPPLALDMQTNPTGRGGIRRKRSSLASGRTDPTKKSKNVDAENISVAAGEKNDVPLEDPVNKIRDSKFVIPTSP